jgi:RHS repeat-associated protein
VTKLVGSNTTHFYYSDQWQILEERLNTGSSADRQFVWGQRYIDDLVLRDQSTTRHYVLNDRVNVTSIINTSGTVQERYGYNAFGTSRVMNASFVVQSSSSYNWETRFAAYRWDSESGLYQVRYRYYHPLLGTWINRDPIAENGGLNLYGFVDDNPIMRFDSFGLEYRGIPIWPLIVPPSIPYYFIPKPPQYPQGFSFCQRDLQADGNFDFPTIIGNMLGGEHSYLQHVDSEGKKWGWGFGIGGPTYEIRFDPNSCKPCKKAGSLKFGIGAGKPADTATDAEIQDCITKNPPTKPYSAFKYNCNDWGKEAAKNCGLDCN